MARKSRLILEGYFKTGDIPTEDQFADLINSIYNMADDTMDDLSEGTVSKKFTYDEKTKLSGIETGAQVNVNPDWNATSGAAKILNKPSVSGTNTGDQDLSGLVAKTTKVNGKALDSDVTLGAGDVGAPSGSGTCSGTNTGDQDLTGLIKRIISSISTATNADALAAHDYAYLVSGTTTLTLPTAVGNANKYTVKNVGDNTITINTTSSQTIDGSTSIAINTKYSSVDLVSDGSNWLII